MGCWPLEAWDAYTNFCGCFKEKEDEQLAKDVKGVQLRSLVSRVSGVLLNTFRKEGLAPGTLRVRVQAEIRTLRAAGLQEKTCLATSFGGEGATSACHAGVEG